MGKYKVIKQRAAALVLSASMLASLVGCAEKEEQKGEINELAQEVVAMAVENNLKLVQEAKNKEEMDTFYRVLMEKYNITELQFDTIVKTMDVEADSYDQALKENVGLINYAGETWNPEEYEYLFGDDDKYYDASFESMFGCRDAWSDEEYVDTSADKIDKGEPFKFNYPRICGLEGLVYKEIGPYFIQKKENGVNNLYRLGEDKPVVSGYDTLGHPFYFRGYDPAYGGKDSENGFYGVLLPVITDDKITMYDFDDFHVVLSDIDNTYSWYNGFVPRRAWHTPMLSYFYFSAYDPTYGGHDVEGKGTGFVTLITKGGKTYLVDANDFNKILAADIQTANSYIDDETQEASCEFCYLEGPYELSESWVNKYYQPEDLVPYTSNILTRKK